MGHQLRRAGPWQRQGGGRLGIVSESGAGKTTLALSLLGHFRPGLQHAAGLVRVGNLGVLSASQRSLREYRRTEISYLGQDSAATLTPTMRVGDQVGELMRGKAWSDAVKEHLEAVGLPGDREFARRYPTSCRADRCSAWHWPEPWRPTRRRSCWMSPLLPSTSSHAD